MLACRKGKEEVDDTFDAWRTGRGDWITEWEATAAISAVSMIWHCYFED